MRSQLAPAVFAAALILGGLLALVADWNWIVGALGIAVVVSVAALVRPD